MHLALYQIVITLLAVLMIGQGLHNLLEKGKGQTFLKFFVRLVVWGGMALVVLFPNSTIWLAHTIGIEGNINAIILTGFLLIFLFIFKLLAAIERLEQQITLLTREESLRNLDK